MATRKKSNGSTKSAATTEAQAAPAPQPAQQPASKADSIRAYAKAHPDAGPKAIAEALTAEGVEVNAGRVSGVLRQGQSSGSVSVDAVKKAAEFVATYGGEIDEALAAIDNVGKFVDACRGSAKAKSALEAYKALAEVVIPNGK